MMTMHHPTTLRLLVLLLVSTSGADAFQCASPWRCQYLSTSSFLFAKKKGKRSAGKGFGDSKKESAKEETTTSETFTPMATKPKIKREEGIQALPDTPVDLMSNEGVNSGQAAVAKMRREQAEKRDSELRRVKDIRDTDKMLQSSPEAAAIPEKVAMRMGKRMLPFVGIPLFGSMGAFVAFWYLATYKNVEFQPGAVATTTIAILVSGLLGITYSIVSASWDEDREGSLFGVEEFQKNVGNIQEGLQRSKENLVVRERMAGLPEAEIEAAIADLEKRDKRQQSIKSKMGEEMENK